MDELKKLSVERLRELARKHLGKGHSRLRTRAQLLEALKQVLRDPLSRLREAAESLVPGKGKVRVVDFPPGRKGRVRGERPGAEGAAASVAPVTAKRAPTAPAATGERRSEAPAVDRTAASATPRQGPGGNGGRVPERVRARGARTGPGPAASAVRRVESTPPQPARPAPEAGPLRRAAAGEATRQEAPVEAGFFEVPAVPRRPRRSPATTEPLTREPFASPREAGTDAPLLLVRDPTTLFVFWDFRRELERGAALGLREPKLLLHVYRGTELQRSLELPLGARSTYVTGLTSGQEYTAEVLLLGRDGWTRPVGTRSAVRRLPPGRVSAQLEVRTLRLPWSEPLSGAPAPSAPSVPRDEPLDSPRRVPLPTSPGARGPGGGPGSSGGPRSGRN
jgi:hypothetical protein